MSGPADSYVEAIWDIVQEYLPRIKEGDIAAFKRQLTAVLDDVVADTKRRSEVEAVLRAEGFRPIGEAAQRVVERVADTISRKPE